MMFIRTVAALLVLAVTLACGCAKCYTDQADREVYSIVADKNAEAFGQKPAFTIQPKSDLPDLLRKAQQKSAALPTEPAPAASLAPAGPSAPGTTLPDPQEILAAMVPPIEKRLGRFFVPSLIKMPEELPSPIPEAGPNAVRLVLADALRVAVRASREYQSQKETVYLAALALTFERYLFRPHPTATGQVNLNNVDANKRRQKTWDGTSSVGVSQQLADGAVITGILGLTALKYIFPPLADTVDSTLNFTLDQPLWRGAGRKVVQENLLQNERNALYAVRTFARFEQTFAVDIASQYLRVLQQRDVVLNTWQNYLSLKEGRERAEWLAKAERLPEFQVDQARQDELRAFNTWIVEREDYVNTLDAFKIVLGLPVTTEVALDPKELDRLTAAGIAASDSPLDAAREKALVTRLDLRNTRDGLEDAGRKIFIAEDGLKGDVDLVASAGYASRGEPLQSARLSFHRGDYSVGLKIDLPVDRLRERNALRQTQITRDQAARALDRLRDDIILAVSRAARRLEQARESYAIQERSVALAERRVESTQLLLQAGRASQRDVLDAQQALLNAHNALTSALVAHTVAGLEFQRDVGTLVVDEEGQIHGWNLTDDSR